MEKKNLLTYEGLQKLETELHDLKVVKRKEVSQKIKAYKHKNLVYYSICFGINKGILYQLQHAFKPKKVSFGPNPSLLPTHPQERFIHAVDASIAVRQAFV